MSRLSQAVTVGFLTGIFGLALLPFGHELEERFGLALLFTLRGTRRAPADVVIVTTDKVSARHLGLPEKPRNWPRSIHARLTQDLIKQGATAIAFDIVFDEARPNGDDHLFAEAIRKARNVILSEVIENETVRVEAKGQDPTERLYVERVLPPIALLAESAAASAPFPLPKDGVRLGQYWTFKTSAGVTPTLPVLAFQVFGLEVYDELKRLLRKVSPSQAEKLPWDREAVIATQCIENLARELKGIFEKNPAIAGKMLEELRSSEIRSMDPKKARLLKSLVKMYQGPDSHYLNFYGPPGTIPTVRYHRALTGPKEATEKRGEIDFRGKMVFVGLSERSGLVEDAFYTVFSQPDGSDLTGVEIAATAFANLLEDMPVRRPGAAFYLATVFLWGGQVGVLCQVFPMVIGVVSTIGLGMAYLAIAGYQFQSVGLWYPLVVPLCFQVSFGFLVTLLWKYFVAHKERKKLKQVFGYYLPDSVVNQLASNLTDIEKDHQIVYGTCLFTDGERYTTLSETMDPKELGKFLNKYYVSIFRPVKQHGGIVSDLPGDSTLSIWTSAHPDAAMRSQACLAALDIAAAVNRFNQASGIFQLPTRIGLHSGRILLGNIGAMGRYAYRPVGDIVNTASRIEGLNKVLCTRILVSEEVLCDLGGFLTRELGEFLLAGKSQSITIHELCCRLEESSEEQRRLCETFAEALDAYKRRSWEESIRLFCQTMNICGEDGPSSFYLKLCEKYRENPPDEAWQGTICVGKG